MTPMPPSRAVIADDERLMRDQLRARLAEAWPELEVIGEAKNGAEAVGLTAALHPDIVFLDIRMPGMSGVDAARAIAQLEVAEGVADDESGAEGAEMAAAAPTSAPASASYGAPTAAGWRGCEIVFITAYDEYAIEAFEHGAVDYVLKPAERERLAVTVDRLRRRLSARHAAAGGTAPQTDERPAAELQQLLQRLATRLDPAKAPSLRWIQATVGQTIQMIPVDDVLFFISDEKYTRVQTATFEALIRKPIKELVEELDANVFWQIHRSTLVNTLHITGVSRDMRGRQRVAVKGHSQKLEVSRSFGGLFKGM